MALVVWSPAAVCFLLLAIFAFRCAGRLRLVRLRLALVERREADLLEAIKRLTQASRTSSHAVLSELERRVRAVAPSIDTMLVFEASGEELAVIRAAGERAKHFEHARYRIDGPPTVLTRAALDGHRAHLRPGTSALIPTDRAALAVPLCAHPRLSLVYLCASKSSELENEETLVRLVEQAGAPFALALEREADHANATYDGLTGLLSARAFRTTLADEIAVAGLSSNATVSLWFIDTDNFKNVNDSLGHGAGDIVLQRMAQILGAHAVPGMDIVARNGGDEFCAIIKNVPKSVAIVRAQRLCEAVAAFQFGMDVRISASIGVATFPTDVQSSNELLEVADAAMYHSKRSGRNRVSFPVEGMRFACYAHEGLPT